MVAASEVVKSRRRVDVAALVSAIKVANGSKTRQELAEELGISTQTFTSNYKLMIAKLEGQFDGEVPDWAQLKDGRQGGKSREDEIVEALKAIEEGKTETVASV